MRKVLFPFFCCLVLISCEQKPKKVESAYVVDTSSFKEVADVATVDFKGLEPWFQKDDEKTYVINFWATWCLPCVKELPYFEYLNQEYKGENVEVILVSLDFPNQKKKRLIPYINKKKLQSKVIHLDDPNEQEWIDKVDKNWTGAIPATLIYNKEKRRFFEQSFSYEDLEYELKQFLN